MEGVLLFLALGINLVIAVLNLANTLLARHKKKKDFRSGKRKS